MGPGFGNHSKISNIHGFLQGRLVGRIKNGIEGNVLKHFMNSEFMRIKNHDVSNNATKNRWTMR